MMRFKFHCTCGDSASGTATPAIAVRVERLWKQLHTGDGHAPCDARTAAAAHRRLYRSLTKEYASPVSAPALGEGSEATNA